MSYAGYSNATGLTHIGDNLHFDAASNRTRGSRYAAQLPNAILNTPTASAPGAITDLVAQPIAGGVGLSGTQPSTDHQPPVTSMTAEYSLTGAGSWTAVPLGATFPLQVTGLSAVGYDFRIKQTNSAGDSSYSNTVTNVTPGASASIESGAVRHWLLGSDNPKSLDMVVGDPLKKVDVGRADLTLSAGYATTLGSNGGARSSLVDSGVQTICMVVRIPSANWYGILGGSGGEKTNGYGKMFFVQNGLLRFKVIVNPTDVLNLTSTTFATNVWVFVAMSINSGVTRLDYYGNSGGATTWTQSGNYSASSNYIGIGDCYFNSGTYNGTHDVAEMIVFNSAKTTSDLNTIYTNSAARLLARGLTLN